MNLPNKLTIFRIILVPIMVIIPLLNIEGAWFGIPYTYWIINSIFIIASVTDKLDGSIARKTNQVTNFGKFADPLADKILVLSAMLLLVEFGKLPAWIPIIILAREFIVSGYRLIAVEKGGNVIAASIFGKIKTVTQIIAIIIAFIDVNSFGRCLDGGLTGIQLLLNISQTLMMTICVITTIISGIDYLKDGKKILM
jgi:CDP-diacylglycerol--glycerol-3-phosphate 3-phosphatidyltransferase